LKKFFLKNFYFALDFGKQILYNINVGGKGLPKKFRKSNRGTQMAKSKKINKSGSINAIVPISAVLPVMDLNPSILPDGTYRNSHSNVGKCHRCNRGIMPKAVFIKHSGRIYGPECVAYIRDIETRISDTDEAADICQHQFRLRMRDLTTAGMKRKGLIKDKPISMSQEDIDLLISMG
jgi:hypothetical protein